MLSSRSSPATAAADLPQRRVVLVFLVAIFTYVFLANAWLGDDAYITFRVVWNVVHGYGPVFNPGERVQAYTHPLWMLVLTAAHFITRDFFFTAQIVSYGFVLAALLRIARSVQWAMDRRGRVRVGAELQGVHGLRQLGARVSPQLFPARLVLHALVRVAMRRRRRTPSCGASG